MEQFVKETETFFFQLKPITNQKAKPSFLRSLNGLLYEERDNNLRELKKKKRISYFLFLDHKQGTTEVTSLDQFSVAWAMGLQLYLINILKKQAPT